MVADVLTFKTRTDRLNGADWVKIPFQKWWENSLLKQYDSQHRHNDIALYFLLIMAKCKSKLDYFAIYLFSKFLD